ncbi:MAG: hypothetical protein LBG14_00240 [Treponema sp.]|jgi:hypothetical protein|nr:hypothetical protein [Treponema sp.]
MKRLLWRVIPLISAAGLSACAAVSSGFIYSDEAGFLKAEPSRVVYSIKSEFVKERDLKVYLYRAEGGLSMVPIEEVITSIRGQRLDSYIFGEHDPGVWEIGVGYADTEPTAYMITVLSAEEQAYYDNRGSKGVEITITGP